MAFGLFAAPMLGPLLDDRDVVILDRRGTAHTQPHLDCPEAYPLTWAAYRRGLSEDAATALQRRVLQRCIDGFLAQGVDLAAYNSLAIAADIDAARRAFGYGRIVLYGASHPTQPPFEARIEEPMKSTAFLRTIALAVLTTSALLSAPAAMAAPPGDLADLVGARGSSGEQEMESRGYTNVTMSRGTQYWWNAGRGSCVGIRVANGRYQSVDSVSASRCGQQAAAAGQKAEIKDLIGSDAVKAFDIMTSRGFTSIDTYTTSDDYLVTWWYNTSTGQCVNTQSKNGRVTWAAEDRIPKCNEAAAKAGGGGTSSAGGTSDSFDTVCGVIVSGKDSPYRCRVTDQYAGGQKTSTTLRFPDQTVELTWRPGNRVGLQFEGMVPKEARYASSEGETNWVFEGKTYYYFSDKDRARSEVQRLRN